MYRSGNDAQKFVQQLKHKIESPSNIMNTNKYENGDLVPDTAQYLVPDMGKIIFNPIGIRRPCWRRQPSTNHS